jgi:hypothetical protein
MKNPGGQEARQGKKDDLPLVAEQHVVNVAHGHSRRRLMLVLSAIIHVF